MRVDTSDRMDIKECVIVTNSLDGVGRGILTNYLVHAYCYKGLCRFTFNGNDYEMKAGDCLITRRGDMIHDLLWSDDFLVDVIYVTREFIEFSTPQSNYGMKGQLALFDNPIMHLTSSRKCVPLILISSNGDRLLTLIIFIMTQ